MPSGSLSPGIVLGVDSSTQSTKVQARRVDTGEVVAVGAAPHPPTTPPASEQDPAAWWEALRRAINDLGEIRHQVQAVSVAGQQHGLVVLGVDDQPLRPAQLWNDTTAAATADRLVAQHAGPDSTSDAGGKWWAERCGSVPLASFTIAKLARLVENEPAIAQQVERVMLPHDYLTFRLSGAHITDRGDASGTGWFDPAANEYRDDLLAAAGLAGWIDRLPTVLGPLEAAGELLAGPASELGLPAGIPVGPGTGDNMGAALGLGLSPGDVALSLGTSGTVYAVSATPTIDPTGAVAGFADAAGGYLPLVCTLNATVVTDTVAAWLGTDAAGLASLALAVPPTPDSPDPVLIPYFDGERTPNLPDASGVFSGLRRTTTREQLARAAHDGVLCGLLDGLDALAALGVDAAGQIRLIGGGARSAAYRQRCADLLGAHIVVPTVEEAVAAGAAVQAAAVAGEETLSSVIERWGLDAGTVVEPSGDDGPSVRAAYADARQNSYGR